MENTEKKFEINQEAMEKVTGGAEAIPQDTMSKITYHCNRLKNNGYTVDQAIAWFDSNFSYGVYGRNAVISIVRSYWSRTCNVTDRNP